MKPHWQQGVNAGDELEALQTDVMRFIAILGLCLVAIFSLVNGVQREPVPTQQLPEPAPVDKPTSSPPPARQVAPDPQVTESPATPERPAPETDRRGFTLEFESGDALGHLLVRGQIQLFAVVDGSFHRLQPDGTFRQVDAPESYHQMDAATVPTRLRLHAEGLYSGSVGWGVVLPAVTVQDIQRLVSTGSGGTLLISADASVRLVSDES